MRCRYIQINPLFLLLLVSISTAFIACNFDRDGGVRIANDMEKYALDYIKKHKLLEPDEKLIAYYDYTLDLNGKEAAIITNKRVIHHNESQNYVMEMAEIKKIEHREESLQGDIIEIYDIDGTMMVIKIAPLNGGNLFLNALKNTVETNQANKAISS